MKFISVKEKKPEENMPINFRTHKNGVLWAGIYRDEVFYALHNKKTGRMIDNFVPDCKDSIYIAFEVQDVFDWVYIPNSHLIKNIFILESYIEEINNVLKSYINVKS